MARKTSKHQLYGFDLEEYQRLRALHEERSGVVLEEGQDPVHPTTLSQPFGTRSKTYRRKVSRRKARAGSVDARHARRSK